jgi:hypothetical protein
MPWRPLGTLTPTTDWQVFPVPTFAKTFRIRYTGDFQRIQSKGYLRQLFSVGQVSIATRLYPKRESVVFEMPIPQDLIDQGQVVRYLSIKKVPKYHRRLEIPEPNWTATIEELI